MSFRTDHYAALAKTLIAKMEKRHFEAHYCATKKKRWFWHSPSSPTGHR